MEREGDRALSRVRKDDHHASIKPYKSLKEWMDTNGITASPRKADRCCTSLRPKPYTLWTSQALVASFWSQTPP